MIVSYGLHHGRLLGKHPQTAYTGLQKSLQQEWDFVQRITLDIGSVFRPMEDVLHNAFLVDLFKGDTSQILRIAVTGLPVNKVRIDLSDPTHIAGSNWTASCVITRNLATVLHRTAEFRSGGHDFLMGESKYERPGPLFPRRTPSGWDG